MASYQHFVTVCRLAADVERVDFNGGGYLAKARVVFTGESRKDRDTDEWVDQPVFMDCTFRNGQGEFGRKLADQALKNLQKGKEVLLEGHLVMETWEKDGQKRSALKLVVDKIIYVGKREDGTQGGQQGGIDFANAPRKQANFRTGDQGHQGHQGGYADHAPPAGSPGDDDDIPF